MCLILFCLIEIDMSSISPLPSQRHRQELISKTPQAPNRGSQLSTGSRSQAGRRGGDIYIYQLRSGLTPAVGLKHREPAGLHIGDRRSERGSGIDQWQSGFFFLFIPGMGTGLNTGLCTGSRSTTDHSEREIRCCASCDEGSCLDLCGEGESGASFL